ncbi:hypothetical protein ACWKSU_16995 (plasmid) [Enterobacter cloacae]|jgi:hypothetical protein|uniref:Uncharacterized protein n=1 Tax=Salmonella enterica subsp. enterica serovar Agona TaxID=58095 RepID=A0A625ACE9_SALET|nr:MULTISPECIES: hypothetical protein [Enterobacteriaceae]EBA3901124.1 hypothetical protein [Salmonella enterica]EBV4714571.1 hypothetical protein [Salmonella enterica subsp. enterica serovar Braenderup]ECH9577069.1 hypothetical protein [Salmonella enterica subsp. enterica serovar Agona]EDT8708956.1 hypothetical protein [Salmonella enterica subsp. salamae]HDG5242113.1 hypothetical protein [Klebsiella pneumoniae]
MCDFCRADENYFHTAECVYDQLVKEYPVMWLRDSTRIGACYLCRELLSPEGMVLAMQSAFPAKGWRLRIWYNEAIDEEIEPQRGDCIELSSRADALLSFMSFQEKI